MPFLTIFSTPKPFSDPHICRIQRNAIQSWCHLGPEVEVLLIGDESGLAETADELGVRHLPQVERNARGTPLISSIFNLARQNSDSPLLCFTNADILFTPSLLSAARSVLGQVDRFLVAGQRWDLDVTQELDFSPGWDVSLQNDLQQRGQLHAASGSDYFLYPRACFVQVPAFAIGRAGWDNWMLYHARCQGWLLVDATTELIVIHQDHDYHHLPGGQPHYRLPETGENIRLAGGRRVIFSLPDATHRLFNGRLTPIPLRGKKLLREAEIFPLTHLHSVPIAEVFYALFHPVKAWGEWRGRLVYWLDKKRSRRAA